VFNGLFADIKQALTIALTEICGIAAHKVENAVHELYPTRVCQDMVRRSGKTHGSRSEKLDGQSQFGFTCRV